MQYSLAAFTGARPRDWRAEQGSGGGGPGPDVTVLLCMVLNLVTVMLVGVKYCGLPVGCVG